ncbi:MAG: protein kinase [Desulfurococcus sp.]|nr:protein kinase [Desulfurococcus sp.]
MNEASELLSEPLNLALLVRKVSIVEPEKLLSCSEILESLVESGTRILEERKGLTYSIIRRDRRILFRILLAGSRILAILEEAAGRVSKGREAFRELQALVSTPGSLCTMAVGLVAPDDLPGDLRVLAEEALSEKAAAPEMWTDRVIYGFKVTRLLGEDEFTFSLEARDQHGNRFTLIVPRPEAFSAFTTLLLNALDAVSYQLMKPSMYGQISTEIAEPGVVEKLSRFTRYLLESRGVIAGLGNGGEYFENPPLVIASFLEGESLPSKTDLASILLVLHRMTGLAAHMNLAGFGFNTLRPVDIVITEDPGEPLGRKPVLANPTSIQRLDSLYRGLYRGLETLDPLSLATRRLASTSNAFMVSMLALNTLLGRPVPEYLQLNKLVLKVIHNIKVDTSVEPGLEEYAENVERILRDAVQSGRVEAGFTVIDRLISQRLESHVAALQNTVPPRILEYLLRTVSLNPDRRYRSPLEAFTSLEKALLEDGYTEILKY